MKCRRICMPRCKCGITTFSCYLQRLDAARLCNVAHSSSRDRENRRWDSCSFSEDSSICLEYPSVIQHAEKLSQFMPSRLINRSESSSKRNQQCVSFSSRNFLYHLALLSLSNGSRSLSFLEIHHCYKFCSVRSFIHWLHIIKTLVKNTWFQFSFQHQNFTNALLIFEEYLGLSPIYSRQNVLSQSENQEHHSLHPLGRHCCYAYFSIWLETGHTVQHDFITP